MFIYIIRTTQDGFKDERVYVVYPQKKDATFRAPDVDNPIAAFVDLSDAELFVRTKGWRVF